MTRVLFKLSENLKHKKQGCMSSVRNNVLVRLDYVVIEIIIRTFIDAFLTHSKQKLRSNNIFDLLNLLEW